jgi:hypothetical protein
MAPWRAVTQSRRMIVRREQRRPTGLPPERRPGGMVSRRGPVRAASERHGLRRGHCPLAAGIESPPLPRQDEPAALDRGTAIRLVRAAARGYCLMMALSDGQEQDCRNWLKSAARLLRFAHLLDTDGIQYSPALAVLLGRLLQRAEE